MCAKATTILNTHMKLYVEAVFADRLREEGFVSLNDKGISWYRCVNGEISNTLSFFCTFNLPPLMPSVGVGVYPLFSDISITNTAHNPDFDNDSVTEVMIDEGSMAFRRFSEDIWIEAPMDGGKGYYTLDKVILPQINEVRTIKESYEYRRNQEHEAYMHLSFRDKVNFSFSDILRRIVSKVFIDEAIYMDDYELFPICRDRANFLFETYEEWCEKYPKNTGYKKELEAARLRKRVFDDNAREEYLQILEQRKQKNIAMLKKRYGIVINKEDSE